MLKEIEETGQLNAMWRSGFSPGTEQHRESKLEKLNNIQILTNSI